MLRHFEKKSRFAVLIYVSLASVTGDGGTRRHKWFRGGYNFWTEWPKLLQCKDLGYFPVDLRRHVRNLGWPPRDDYEILIVCGSYVEKKERVIYAV